MASALCETKKVREGLRLFEDLIDNMNQYYVDEREKMRMYPTILSDYSTALGRSKRHDESIEYAIKGEEIEVKRSKLTLLPTFAINRACAMLSLGEKENCLPIFALAHYGSGLLGKQKNAVATSKYVKEHLAVDF